MRTQTQAERESETDRKTEAERKRPREREREEEEEEEVGGGEEGERNNLDEIFHLLELYARKIRHHRLQLQLQCTQKNRRN